MRYENPKIRVYHAIGGWQTMMVAYLPEDHMIDVVQTGMGPYRTRREAELEAESWAKAENIPYEK